MSSVSHTPVSLLRDGNFRALWAAGILVGTVRWLELLAFGIYAVEVTGSPFLVALLALLRFAPLILFGVFIGALADRANVRTLLSIAFGLSGLISLVMAGLFLTGQAMYWHVAVAAFASGTLWASDMPLRRKLMGDIAGLDRLARAMSLDTATSNGTRLFGPFVGGLAYQLTGGTGVFAICAVLYLLSLFIVLTMRGGGQEVRPHSGIVALRPLAAAWSAVKYARHDREVTLILAVTLVFNIWGFPMLSMMPVLGKDELGLSAATIGTITALEGGFAFIGALLVARFVRPDFYRACYYFAVWIYLAWVCLMGVFPGVAMLAAGLIGAGLAGAGFSVMQSTLIYTVAPAEMRGRLLGLITIGIGSGLLGFANIGFLAELFGASTALWIMALEGIVPMIVIGLAWPQLRGQG